MEASDRAVRAAIAEIQTPTRGVTQQFLAVHQVSLDRDQPAVAYVDTSVEPGSFLVYFFVEGEPYYFVVAICSEHHQLVVSDSYFEARVRTYLAIYSPILSADDITQRLKIVPTQTCAKGERIRPNITKLFDEHRWYLHPNKNIPGDIEDKLRSLLDQIQPATEQIVELVEQYSCRVCIHIGYQGYKDQMWGWHADQQTIQRISSLHASLDLDLYASGPDLPE